MLKEKKQMEKQKQINNIKNKIQFKRRLATENDLLQKMPTQIKQASKQNSFGGGGGLCVIKKGTKFWREKKSKH